MICLPYFLSAATSFTENISNNSHDDKEREQDSYLHILLFGKRESARPEDLRTACPRELK